MPRVKGFFHYFPGFEDISLENIIDRLNLERSSRLLQNKLCNRLFYSQTIPFTPADLDMDLEILKEIIKSYSQKYYNQNLRAIYIPEMLLERFPDLPQLAGAFIEIFNSEEISTIYLKSEDLGVKNIGTLLKPKNVAGDGWASVWVDDKEYKADAGEILLIPAAGNRADIKYKSSSATLLGKNELVTEVAGGRFGIALDMR